MTTAGAITALVLALVPMALSAHENEAEATATPQLQIDKAEQRRLNLRTRRVDAPLPSLSLPARVVADPRGNARVMPDQPGIVESPAGGFAQPGQVVVAGQLLAVLKPTLQEPQRRDLEGQLAMAQRDVALAHLQIKRYSIDEAKSFDGLQVTPSMQIMVEYQSALAREAQLQRALSSQVELRAPVSGRVLSSSLRAGRVVAAGDTLFELSSPQALAVEMLITAEHLNTAAASVALASGNRTIALRFLGQAMDTVVRTPRALYAVSTVDSQLAVGEPLRLIVPVAEQAGWRIPASGVFHRDGDDWVWIHEDAETFVARRVRLSPLDSGWVQVEHGLQARQRVVVDGAQALAARLPAGKARS